MVTMRGPLNAAAMRHFHAEILAEHCDNVRAFVVDFTRAVVMLDGASLDSLLGVSGDDSPEEMPAALVVRPDCIALFRGHALRVAGRHGITRRVFVDLAGAVAWARGAGRRHYLT